MTDTHHSLFPSSRLRYAMILLILFGLGLGIRIYDITDLPLDFHPTRQLFSAVKARGMYYQTLSDVPEWKREFALRQWENTATIEPEILERLASTLFRVTGEQLWIPRLLSAIFWVLGGISVYLLARDIVSREGAVLTLAFYLFVPYGVFASRSFQPDPLMTALIVFFWWTIVRWTRRPAWKWALLAGFVGGMAILVKFVAAFFVIGGALGALLGAIKLRTLLRNKQVWTMVVLGFLPGAAWVVYGVYFAGFLSSKFSGRFIPSLLLSPSFYLSWQTNVASVVGGAGVALGLLGLFLIKRKDAHTFLIGIWSAYFVFGLYFDHHIATHDYYSLPLIPIVALSLAVSGDFLFKRLLDADPKPWARSVIMIIFLYAILSAIWGVRNNMKAIDYRPQEAFWSEISQVLGPHASLAALTEYYGYPLRYWGWQSPRVWPSSDDIKLTELRGNRPNVDALFEDVVKSKAYFLVTDMNDFEKQPALRAHLEAYPVYAQGEGYILYDLQHPIGINP